MATRLADRLATARRRRFVGRQAEKKLFETAVTAVEPPFSVMFIHGPGGVGKTSLLRECMRIAQQAEAMTIYLDGRNFDPTPAAFLSGLNSSLGVATTTDWYETLERQSQRFVLFVDTHETLTSLDTWLRDLFLPQLPADATVVLAGRNPP